VLIHFTSHYDNVTMSTVISSAILLFKGLCEAVVVPFALETSYTSELTPFR
jgi:hypothetical protein